MQKLDELNIKAAAISTKIDFLLEKQKVYKAEEFLQFSSAEYSRQANIKKLKEKLNMVALSRSKANKANQNLLDDFDRVQKHLSLMDKRTEELLNKVDSQKRYLDMHYPNWREKANIITSPNYLNQEELFNMLDSLKCKVFNEDNPPKTFESFAQSTNIRLESKESLVELLKNTRFDNENNKNQLNETACQIPEIPLAEEAKHDFDTFAKPEHIKSFGGEKPDLEFRPDDNFINLQNRFSTPYPVTESTTEIKAPEIELRHPSYPVSVLATEGEAPKSELEQPLETLTNITAIPESIMEKDGVSDAINTPRSADSISEQPIVKPPIPPKISTFVQQYQSDGEDDIENMLNPAFTESKPLKDDSDKREQQTKEPATVSKVNLNTFLCLTY